MWRDILHWLVDHSTLSIQCSSLWLVKCMRWVGPSTTGNELLNLRHSIIGTVVGATLKPRCVTRELLPILQKVSYENTLVLHLVYMHIYICISVYWCHWEILCQHRFQYRFVARWCELITRLSSPWCRNWHWQRIHMRHYVEAYSDSNKITNTLES